MSFEVTENGVEKVLTIQEELLSNNIRAIEEGLNNEIAKDNMDIVIDLVNVKKIDSMSIAAIIRLKNKLSDMDRDLKLTNPNEGIMRVLELSGLDEFLLD